jgi:hypothetical protein
MYQPVPFEFQPGNFRTHPGLIGSDPQFDKFGARYGTGADNHRVEGGRIGEVQPLLLGQQPSAFQTIHPKEE